MAILGFVLVFIGGSVLGGVGFGMNTWQYYAISLPLIFGAMMVGAAK
jgi:hypothetical protein